MMDQLKNDPVFDALADCPACVLDYCLFKSDAPYCGEASHREALGCAMRAVSEDGEEPLWTYDLSKASAVRLDARSFRLGRTAARFRTGGRLCRRRTGAARRRCSAGSTAPCSRTGRSI